MYIQILAGIIILAVIVMAVTLREWWPYQRQAVKTLSTDIRKLCLDLDGRI
jgi:hypothetical protein